MYKAKIDVTLKKSILDPQGKTALQALGSLGFDNAKDLRVGKHFVLTVDAATKADATKSVNQMCEILLVNPVIEEYSVQLEALSGTA
jgi:phosphoribosylformylglycinamidine synthase subunit PurS